MQMIYQQTELFIMDWMSRDEPDDLAGIRAAEGQIQLWQDLQFGQQASKGSSLCCRMLYGMTMCLNSKCSNATCHCFSAVPS